MSKKLKGTPDRVWLAGLGALAVAEQEGNDLFQQLVQKGRDVEKTLGDTPTRTVGSVIHSYAHHYAAAKNTLLKQLLAKSKKAEDSPLRGLVPSAEERKGIEARQTRRLAAARRAFLKEFGGLDKSTVDWEGLQREHKIFTVTHRGATYVPSFQFDKKGKPRPAVAKVIEILGKDTSDWDLALWFTTASGRLDGKRPVDLLSSHPEQVVQAAEQEAAELVF
jgi:hypothetical protein